MKKSIFTLIILMFSITVMAQVEPEQPAINFQSIGLSIPLESEESVIQSNGYRATYRDMKNGNCPSELLSNVTKLETFNEHYNVTVHITNYSPETMEETKNLFIPHLMSHINIDIPGSVTFRHTIYPNYDTYEDLDYSLFTLAGFLKKDGFGEQESRISYTFVYIRPLGIIAVFEIFGEPELTEFLDNYASQCIRLDRNFFTGNYLTDEQLKNNDDGVNFIQSIIHGVQAYTDDKYFIEFGNNNIGHAYRIYKEFFGHNAPSYNKQDKVLTKEEKESIKHTVEEHKQQMKNNNEKNALDRIRQNAQH